MDWLVHHPSTAMLWWVLHVTLTSVFPAERFIFTRRSVLFTTPIDYFTGVFQISYITVSDSVVYGLLRLHHSSRLSFI